MPSGRLEGNLELLRSACSQSPSVLVAFSGGKDSLATLDMCQKVFPRVEAYLMTLVPGLESIEGPAEQATRRAKVRLHKVQHWMTSIYLARGVFCVPAGVRQLKQRDIELEMRSRTGIEWIAYGQRAIGDGISRNLMLKRCQGKDEKGHRLFPIWNWSLSDVLCHLRARRIPLPPRVGRDHQRGSSGLELNTKCMVWLHQNHPADYERVRRVFPHVETLIRRQRWTFDSEAAQGSEVQP